jgi:hypothetical protein
MSMAAGATSRAGRLFLQQLEVGDMMPRASIISVTAAACLGLPAVASAVGAPAHKRAFTAVAVGAQISANGNRFENVYRVKRSPDGGGAGIQDGVLLGSAYPATVTDTMKFFYVNGTQRTSDVLTLQPPHTDGIGVITGKGTCTTGTGMHQGEKCTYAVSGTYDLQTGVTMLHFAGTYTRSARPGG